MVTKRHEVEERASVVQTQESKVASEATAPRAAGKSKGPRLVIRVTITPEPPPQPVRPSIRARTIGLFAAVLALLTLGWFGVSALRDDPAATTLSAEQSNTAPQLVSTSSSGPDADAGSAAHATRDVVAAADVSASDSMPANETTPTLSSDGATPSPINEVVPQAPRSALQTITGTVRVVIRADIDQSGTVVATTSEIPGPSRYFERLAREAAMKWTFTPTNAAQPRSMSLRFYFKRQGVTAEAAAPN
jgi:TonB family protein